MAKAILIVKSVIDESPATLEDKLITGQGQQASMVHERLGEFYKSLGSGIKSGKTVVRIDSSTTASTDLPLKDASLTVNCLSTTATSDTLTIGPVVFTFTATTQAVSTNVAISGATTAMAANLATKINSYSLTGKLLEASASASAVTITWKGGAREASLVRVVESSAALSLSATSFAPGTTLAAGSDAITIESGMD